MKIEEEIQQKKFRNEYQKSAINLMYTYGWLNNKQKKFFSEYGITPQQFNVLRILKGQYPDAISTSEIKVSCVIEEKYTELAVRALHDAFKLGEEIQPVEE